MPGLGVCYYPEQWPDTMWERDAAGMAAAGIAQVRIGEFAWGRIEKRPGDIDLDWMLRAMDILHAHGLRVMVGTPTAAPPHWMAAKHPDMLQVGPDGHQRTAGSRRHYCFSHLPYRDECRRIARIVAEAVKGHPALAAWQIDNEYGCHETTLSYSPAALAGFRAWLRTRYGSLERLNEAWGTRFWSSGYDDFETIGFPHVMTAEASPTHRLDFRRFSSDQVIAFHRAQAEILRDVTPGVPISTNFMAAPTSFDHHGFGDALDIATWDSYPLGNLASMGGSERHLRYARQGDPDLQALCHDLYRCIGRGRWQVMEQQPGPVNWGRTNPDPLPGMVRLWSWEALAHGAEIVSYFRWRQLPYGPEQMHTGLMRPDDRPAPALTEARQIAHELGAIGDIAARPAECAIVFDYESSWAWQIEAQGEGFGLVNAVGAQYRALRRLGLDVDILPPDIADLSAYRLVAIPALFTWSDPLRAALARFEGVTLIGPRSGAKTRDFHIPARLPPDLDPALLDVTVARVETLPGGLTVPLAGGGSAALWREKIETSAQTLIASEDGWPLLVRQGRHHYLGALLDDDGYARVTRKVCAAAAIPVRQLPPGLRTRRAGPHCFVFNYGLETHDLAALGFAGPFGLDGPILAPAGVATARG